MNPPNVKVVILGKSYGGKTSLMERFLYNRFRGQCTYQSTIGAAFGAKSIEVNGQKVILAIWDTAGSEHYKAMVRTFYRKAQAAIICYEIISIESFNEAQYWVNEMKTHEPNCKIYLCGTKKDLVELDETQRKIDSNRALVFADEINAVGIFETSSKNNEGVDEMFLAIAENFVTSKEENEKCGLESLLLESNNQKQRRCC